MFGATAVRQKREREKREKLGKPRKESIKPKDFMIII